MCVQTFSAGEQRETRVMEKQQHFDLEKKREREWEASASEKQQRGRTGCAVVRGDARGEGEDKTQGRKSREGGQG